MFEGDIPRPIALVGIAAISSNRVLGNKGKIPWHLPAELRHFRKTTVDHPLIMGRATFDSIDRKPLDRRQIVVLSRQPPDGPPAAGVLLTSSIRSALTHVSAISDRAFVAGGAQIFAALLPYIGEFILTTVHQPFDGDTFLPEFEHDFLEVQSVTVEDRIDFTISCLQRPSWRRITLLKDGTINRCMEPLLPADVPAQPIT